eukprot:GFUD01100284.1.p1 GENE.GFUD01100284.1~~GFUD01100284.1.p1  ORF type:complete len:155 (+),score=50.10 GFUD01100284.1:36-467(+)
MDSLQKIAEEKAKKMRELEATYSPNIKTRQNKHSDASGSSEECPIEKIRADQMRKMVILDNKMKQIELEGKAKLATIHQDKMDSFLKNEEETAEKLRKHAATSTSKDDINRDFAKLEREFEKQQKNIKTKHKRRMDSLNQTRL